MNARLLALGAAGLAVVVTAGVAFWPAAPETVPVTDAPLPVPPFPPRIAEGETYERCLALLVDDPAGASTLAEGWQVKGGGDGAAHCQALAQIALGRPEVGAGLLEELAARRPADRGRASLLGQAAQARLMGGDADRAFEDAGQAIAAAPDDVDLLLIQANAADALDRAPIAINDLNRALAIDPHRIDALVLRAVSWRRLNKLDLALADVNRAISIDPEEPEALLERGILRQRRGDRLGAAADWQHARQIDPNGTVADLAEQNLALLEAGPDRR